MARKPTIKDVASLAGVGPMTVSRLLNQSANVSEEAAVRIYRAIEELGYKPNEMARALRGQKSSTIGIIVPYLYDSFFAMCAHGVSTVAREHGYSMILTTSDEDPEDEYAEAQSMLRRNVDGLIVIPASQESTRLTLPEFQSTHIVALDRPLPDRRFCSVVVENRAGAEIAVTHLISAHGHRRIAAAALTERLYTFCTRVEGYTVAMKQAGLEPLPVMACPTPEQAAANVRQALRGPNAPTAIFTTNGLTTRYVFKALRDVGIRIPQDLAVVAFDDFELAELLEPQLSVIRQPAVELGSTAAKLLFERMAGGQQTDQGTRLVLPVEWVPRSSCGCHASVVAEFVPQARRQAV
ncbi:MAG TPA: LacI family DNA-binding transcriptional regulator [Acidobacteriaceae bacterium]|nr:LacI family DNA-binding transcriptional regulator [Acidobacteriaceae bacterium]